jgi:hypothetical protein
MAPWRLTLEGEIVRETCARETLSRSITFCFEERRHEVGEGLDA